MITDFSAKEPALGYYHQIRFSLYLLLIISKDMINPCLKLENLDDIEVDDIDRKNLYQTKLHINSIANLTDRSPDFWKTIRIWSENISMELIDINNTIFSLITTAKTSKDSFINNFNINNSSKDNIKATLDSMLNICSEKTNEINRKGYEAFSSLTTEQQQRLISNIRIIDSSLSIEDTLSELKKELRFSAPTDKVDVFVERIEGWWFQECIKILCLKRDSISANELNRRISDIRDSFQEENLPDDFADPMTISEEELPNYEMKVFVKQLKLIAIKNTMLRNAISDFRRAYEQRSRWLREDLANMDEYERFDNQLKDYWNNIFAIIKDECEDFSSEKLEKAGHEFYKKYYVESVPPCRIRAGFQSQYLTRGSCHMLADEKKIGWHPNFNILLDL